MKLDRAELIAELINIYEDLKNKASHQNQYDYELLAHLKSLKLQFERNGERHSDLYDGRNDSDHRHFESENFVMDNTASPFEYTDPERDFEIRKRKTPLRSRLGMPVMSVYATELTAPTTSEIDFDFTSKFQSELTSQAPAGAMATPL
ncbi:MAG: hypothetical protein V8T86_05790 [Victivallis sp.]